MLNQCAVPDLLFQALVIEPAALRTTEAWITERRTSLERRLDRLGAYLAEQDDEPNQGN